MNEGTQEVPVDSPDDGPHCNRVRRRQTVSTCSRRVRRQLAACSAQVFTAKTLSSRKYWLTQKHMNASGVRDQPHLDEKTRWGRGCRLHSAEGIPEREEAGRSHYRPGSLNNWPLQAISHLTLHTEVLLVSIHGHRHRTVLQFLYFVPSHEGLQSRNPGRLLHSLPIPN